jgi:hypothetical protein
MHRAIPEKYCAESNHCFHNEMGQGIPDREKQQGRAFEKQGGNHKET